MDKKLSRFDKAFEQLIDHEGGYVNNPRDPGGETKFGISKRSYPSLNIKSLTINDAKAIYMRDFWIPIRADVVPDFLYFDLFDTAVNSGVVRAVKLLQAALGVEQDGVFGPITMSKTSSAGPIISAKFNAKRLEFMTSLANWDDAGKGWARRIAANILRLT